MTIQEAAANVGKQIRSAIPIRPPNGGHMPRGIEFRLKEFDQGPPLKFMVYHASEKFGSFDLPCSSENLDWFITEADWKAGAPVSAL